MDMRVKIAGVEWNNPVTVASGTFGSGEEYSEFVDLNRLGAVTTKGVANVPWPGNPTPRVAEIHSGMMNAIGLQNPGIDVFCKRDIPFLRQYDTKIIVNVCGRSTEDYCEVVERLANEDVDMLEINISCPNVKEGGIAFGQNPKAAEEITRAVKKYAKQPVIMKLSPNVTSISEMAKAVEAGGADAISLINTLTGMKIDINRKTFALANKTGGVSGPAIHPIAVRMVYEAANAVNVPIIGMGGIETAEDAIEMLLVGASAVSVGTANFYNPNVTMEIVDGIARYMEQNHFASVQDMVGIVKKKKEKGCEKSDTSFFHVCGHSLKDAVICCDIVVKVLYDRCHMVCFQSSHIKLSFPVRVGDLNDFYIHSEKVCHIWNDCHPESFRNETCDYDVLVYFIRNLGLHLYFLKQIVNNTSQTGGLRKINLGIRSQFLQIC